MLDNKGILSIQETTSLLSKDYLLKADNLLPDEGSVTVRSGCTKICDITDDTGQNTRIGDGIIPIAFAPVIISSEEFLLMVSRKGYLYAVFPDRINFMYKVCRRYYDTTESIRIVNQITDTNTFTPNHAVIETVGNYIYILSKERSWVIHKDGIIRIINANTPVDSYIVVDAEEATIQNCEGQTPKLVKMNRRASLIEKNARLYVRARSEFGGRGAQSLSVIVPERNSYIVYGIDGMTNLSGVEN